MTDEPGKDELELYKALVSRLQAQLELSQKAHKDRQERDS